MSLEFNDNTRKTLAKMKVSQNKGLGQALHYFAGQAGQNTPTDTGRLKASIVSSAKIKKFGNKGTIGTNVEYSIYIEFGTIYITPFAMFRKTGETEKDKIGNIIGNVIKNG